MRLFLFVFLIFAGILSAQDKCKIITDEKSEKPMIIGETDIEMFQDTSFSWWYNSEYDFYKIDTADFNCLKKNLNEYKIEIVMGTWCSDSRREVPRFIKLLDSLNFSQENLKIINVDREKKDLNGEVESLNIELVPTFIFYKEGIEQGRIIEVPEETLEFDTAKIIGCNKESE